MRNEQDNIEELIIKSFLDELSIDERREFEIWLDNSYNRMCYNAIISWAHIREKRSLYQQIDERAMWTRIKKEIGVKEKKEVILLRIIRYAAVVLLVAGISGLMFQYSEIKEVSEEVVVPTVAGLSTPLLITQDGKKRSLQDTVYYNSGVKIEVNSEGISYDVHQEQEDVAYHTLVIPKGQNYSLKLSDGSNVWLKAGSVFKYPLVFGKERKVYLEEGEAYFEVFKNVSKPFITCFASNKVEVLGTRFNIKAYKDEEVDFVTLAEGKVKVNDSVELSPNTQAAISGTIINVKKVDASVYIAWVYGDFVYKSEKLHVILEDIARYHDIKVFYKNDRIKNQVFSLKIKQHQELDKVLNYIEMTGDVKFERFKNNVTVQ